MLVPFLGAGLLPAQEIEVTRFGWEGKYQPGRWTPLRVQLADVESESSEFVVSAKDADGNIMSLRQTGVPTGNSNEYELTIKLGRLEDDVRVQLIDDDQVIATTDYRTQTAERLDTAVKLDHEMLGCLSSNDSFVKRMSEEFGGMELPGRRFVEVIPLAAGGELPCQSKNWESLEVLLLSTEQTVPADRATALLQWVREGGQLILSVDSVASWEKSPMQAWVPLNVGRELKLRDLSQFESFVGRSSRIEFTGRVDAIELTDFLGTKVIDSIDGPLVVSLPYGFGNVIVSAVSLDRGPLSNWNSIPRLLQKLAFPELSDADRDGESKNQQLTDNGINELATQLGLAQQDFPDVQRSSIWVVMASIAIYLLLIGPLDYFLVHRVLKRPELTWLTFPVLMIGMAVVSVWAGRSTNSIGTSVNQVDIVDIDSVQQLAKFHSMMTGYNPVSQRVSVKAQPRLIDWTSSENATADPASLSWDSTPEDGFGGLYRQSGFESVSSTSYHSSANQSVIEDIPVAQWSTVSLTADQFVRGIPLVSSDLKGSTLGSISGTVEHRLPGELVEWMLVYGNRVYFPRPTRSNTAGVPIPANQPTEITRSDLSVSRDLKGYLTGTRQVRVKSDDPTEKTKIVVEQEAYDLFSTDPRKILRMLSFHNAAGGTEYTNMENSALDDLDWTRYLNPRHAVLYGILVEEEGSPSVCEWLWNGEKVTHDRKTTVIRCLLPVELQNDSRRELPDLEERLKNYKP